MTADAMPISTDLSALSLAEIARLVETHRLPPVDHWQPPHCGHSGMRIARDGSWYHEGSPIGRPSMVRLFSTILRRESEGRFVLVTPIEKLDIDVEDAPFIAVELKSEGERCDRRLAFRLNTGDLIVADAEHPLRIANREDGPHPYVEVRRGLEALVSRPVYYELAHLALEEESEPRGLWSGGAFFPLEAPR
jgi:hypothetical protein